MTEGALRHCLDLTKDLTDIFLALSLDNVFLAVPGFDLCSEAIQMYFSPFFIEFIGFRQPWIKCAFHFAAAAV